MEVECCDLFDQAFMFNKVFLISFRPKPSAHPRWCLDTHKDMHSPRSHRYFVSGVSRSWRLNQFMELSQVPENPDPKVQAAGGNRVVSLRNQLLVVFAIANCFPYCADRGVGEASPGSCPAWVVPSADAQRETAITFLAAP